MKKDYRLYNLMFPIWMMYLIPTWLWLIILPVNFAVDSLVLLLAARHYKIENRFELWKKSILKIWIIGFLCDFVGAGFCLGMLLTLSAVSVFNYDVGYYGVFAIAIPAVILSGVLIYFLNRWISFGKTDIDKALVNKLCLVLAIFTAPYTMLIPMYL